MVCKIIDNNDIAQGRPLFEILGESAVTVGFFDGVHRGHSFLVSKLKELASNANLQTVVVTFLRHPAESVLGCDAPSVLCTNIQKLQWLSKLGVDVVVLLDFDREMSMLTSEDFIFMVVKRMLKAKILLTGYDNKFGSDRWKEHYEYLEYCRKVGVEFYETPPYYIGGKVVSSSVVRKHIEMGHMEDAAQCLGRPYILTGKVVAGEHIGRTIGFPTANLSLAETRLLVPLCGVYAVRVDMENEEKEYSGMMNIGSRPTFNGKEQTIEVNIFGYSGNIYSRMLQVQVLKRIRKEQRFASTDELKAQLERDKKECMKVLEQYNEE